MARYLVSVRGDSPATVNAGNWITALGLGLDKLGITRSIDRLACEVLPNGTVIARDVASGHGFVVQPMDAVATPVVAADPDDEDTHLFAMEPDPDEPSEEVDLALFMDADEDTESVERSVNPSLVDAVRQAPSSLLAWQVALDVAQQLVPAEAGAALRSEPDGSLRFVGATGPYANQLVAIVIPWGTGIAGFCVERGSGIVIRNAYRDPRFYSEVDRATGYATRAILCVPVMGSKGVVGCLELLNPPAMQSFSRANMATLEAVASVLALRLADER